MNRREFLKTVPVIAVLPLAGGTNSEARRAVPAPITRVVPYELMTAEKFNQIVDAQNYLLDFLREEKRA